MRLYLHVCLCMNVHVHVSHFHVIARRPAPATRSPVVFFRNLLPFWLKIRAQANLLQIGITFAELKSRLHQAMVRFAVLFASLVVSAHSSALNPVRKVVTLLQSMQQKVQDEGTQELELYNRYMCHCRSGGADLSGTIGAAEEKVPAVSSDIEESEARLTGAKADLKQAQSDRAAAKATMAQATALREKEAAAFSTATLHRGALLRMERGELQTPKDGQAARKMRPASA